jgi:HEAT repeat protein
MRRRRFRLVGSVGIALVFVMPACSPRPVDRVRKIQALPESGRTFPKLRRHLADRDPSVRAAAVAALDLASGPEASRAVSTAITDRDALVRSMAALRLGESKDPASVELLLQRLAEDDDWSVRLRCAEALGASGAPEAEPALSRATSDPDRSVRLASVRALSSGFASTSIEILSRALVEDPDWEIRVEAASGLARSSMGEAIPPLEQALQDPSEFVRAEAASGIAALHKLGLQAPPPPGPPDAATGEEKTAAAGDRPDARGSGV